MKIRASHAKVKQQGSANEISHSCCSRKPPLLLLDTWLVGENSKTTSNRGKIKEILITLTILIVCLLPWLPKHPLFFENIAQGHHFFKRNSTYIIGRDICHFLSV